jgi:hypothetical protein
MTDKPAPSVNEAALLEVVRTARQLLYVLSVVPEAEFAPTARSELREAIANLDRLTP